MPPDLHSLVLSPGDGFLTTHGSPINRINLVSVSWQIKQQFLLP